MSVFFIRVLLHGESLWSVLARRHSGHLVGRSLRIELLVECIERSTHRKGVFAITIVFLFGLHSTMYIIKNQNNVNDKKTTGTKTHPYVHDGVPEGVTVQMQGGTVADAHVQRAVLCIVRFNHGQTALVHEPLGQAKATVRARNLTQKKSLSPSESLRFELLTAKLVICPCGSPPPSSSSSIFASTCATSREKVKKTTKKKSMRYAFRVAYIAHNAPIFVLGNE